MLSTERNVYHLENRKEIHPDFTYPPGKLVQNNILYVRHITESTFDAVIIRSPITSDWYIIKINKSYEIRGIMYICKSIYAHNNELYISMYSELGDESVYIGSHLILELEYEYNNQIDPREIIPWDM